MEPQDITPLQQTPQICLSRSHSFDLPFGNVHEKGVLRGIEAASARAINSAGVSLAPEKQDTLMLAVRRCSTRLLPHSRLAPRAAREARDAPP
jgi:hypothetical protein